MPLSPTLQQADADLIVLFRSLQSRRDVAKLLEIPDTYLCRILYRRRDRSRYRRFDIPKRSGGVRTISAPSPALSILQSKLNYIFRLTYKAKPCVHGFVLNRNIVSNALPHVDKRWVFNIDLEDFFPSIHIGRIRGALMARPFALPAAPATVIAQICTTVDGILPQGAPSSPIIANLVCGRVDGDMMALARRFHLRYTRYCDDLTFSSRQHSFPSQIGVAGAAWIGEGVEVGSALQSVVESNGFHVNAKKTRLQLRSCHQEVTGLTVNEFPNVSRHYVHSIRGMVHAWKTHGLTAAATTFVVKYSPPSRGNHSPENLFRSALRGRIEFVGMIRGRTDPVYCKLRQSLHLMEPTLIPSAPTPSGYPRVRSRSTPMLWSDIFARWKRSVFQLETTSLNGDVHSGSAFAMYPNCIGTAAHNLVGAVTCVLPSTVIPLSGCSSHAHGPHQIDGALVACVHSATPIPHEDRLPEPGEDIAIIGYASVPGRQPEIGIYAGIVESLRSNHTRTLTFIQVSMASSGGLSGSPVLDRRGRVVGIVIESTFEDTQDGVPRREFCTVLPISCLVDIHRHPVQSALPLVLHA